MSGDNVSRPCFVWEGMNHAKTMRDNEKSCTKEKRKTVKDHQEVVVVCLYVCSKVYRNVLCERYSKGKVIQWCLVR